MMRYSALMSFWLRVKSAYSGEGLSEWKVKVPFFMSWSMICLSSTLVPKTTTQ